MINHLSLRLAAVPLVALLPAALAFANTSPACNFVVRSADGHVDCDSIVRQCERLRGQLFEKWHGSPAVHWNPRCELVIHHSRASYRQHVGPGSDQTSGSSLIRFSQRRVVHRRIDLLADSNGDLSALPHELTHLVLADVFGGRKPPPWVDEGIATLADPEPKRTLHHRDCRDAIEAGAAFRVAELLTLDRLTRADQFAAFYGQSLSLTRFLVEKNDPKRFVEFVNHSFDVGYDQAIRKHYGFESIADLERAWRHFERTHQSTREELASGKEPPAEPFVELIRVNDRTKLP